MVLKIKEATTSRGNKTNEDIYNSTSNAAWIMDGSSGLTGIHITDADSDAKWFVQQWDMFLKDNIIRCDSLSDIIKSGVKTIQEKYKGFQSDKALQSIDYPSASITVARLKDGLLEYFMLGDCPLVFKELGEKAQLIYDDRVSKLDSAVIGKMKSISAEKEIAVVEARKYCEEDIKKNRGLKNTEKGYWILEFNEEAINYALTGIIPVARKLSLCMMTDGFSQYYDTLKLAENYDEFFQKLENSSLEQMLEEIRKTQEEDPNCNRYPRFKKGDDATAVYLEIE